MYATPPKHEYGDDDDEDTGFHMPAGTPAPHRARVNNLENQVSELVRNKMHTEKRHKADLSKYRNEMDEVTKELEKVKAESKMRGRELERCKAEGDGMREELNLYSAVQQQKAVLALAQEQMQIIELERRLVQADAEKVMRDHRISLFKARESDVLAEMAEKDARLEELEDQLANANTSAGHQRASDSKSLVSLESKVEKLEAKIASMSSTEKELRKELASLLDCEKSNDNSLDKEKRQLQAAVKAAKSELATKDQELSDAQEELADQQASSKEREKALKQKLKEVTLEKDRLAGLEDELDAMKVSARMRSASQSVQPEEPASTKKVTAIKGKDKAKKQIEAIEEAQSEEEEPVVEKSKKKVVEKPVVKAKEIKVVAPRVTVRKATPIDEESENGDDYDAPAPKKKVKETKPVAPKLTVRKATPVDEESENGDDYDVPAPKKKARTPARSVSPHPDALAKKPGPLGEAHDNLPAAEDRNIGSPFKVMKPLIVKKKSKPALVDDDDAHPEKKKKRKLLGVQPAFQWDSIMNSGDGVIPSTLSPLKPAMKTGTIPRIGFSGSASSRTLSRLH